VQTLAKQKAIEVAARQESQGYAVLGADTVVAIGNKVLGKPKDEADAFQMLSKLSGRTHEVYTGVCMLYPENGEIKKTVAFAKTDVYFNTLTKEQIIRYVQTGSPMDKAGAYGIQDGDLVERIDGSFSNVVGLPVELCKKLYAKIVKEIEND
jgi:septum formation protein